MGFVAFYFISNRDRPKFNCSIAVANKEIPRGSKNLFRQSQQGRQREGRGQEISVDRCFFRPRTLARDLPQISLLSAQTLDENARAGLASIMSTIRLCNTEKKFFSVTHQFFFI